jgi:SAM-dependent methyltransferase
VAAFPASAGRELSAGPLPDDPITSTIHDSAARGFDSGAEAYERGRPGYPSAAIDLLVSELGLRPGTTIVDLAAGTGKLTRSLIPTGARVIAIEPVPAMRAQLARTVPAADAMAGTAEAMPLADASADAVLVAQAFHWFNTPAAAREIHRVLRPGGGLGVVWNVWDDTIPWVARMQRLVGAYRGDTPQRGTSAWREQLVSTALFTPLADRTLSNVVTGSLDILLARTASISFIATLPDAERAKVLEDVRAVISDEHPEALERGPLEMPYVTQVAWCHTRELAAP